MDDFRLAGGLCDFIPWIMERGEVFGLAAGHPVFYFYRFVEPGFYFMGLIPLFSVVGPVLQDFIQDPSNCQPHAKMIESGSQRSGGGKKGFLLSGSCQDCH